MMDFIALRKGLEWITCYKKKYVALFALFCHKIRRGVSETGPMLHMLL